MSQNTNPTVNGDNKTSASGSIASVWARGPPSAVSSTSASKNQSGANTPSQDGAGLSNLTSASNSTAISIRNAHSRQNSLLVGPGNIAFGTVDSPNTALSSSPAAPSTTGGHLADAVKSFGSIDADGNSDPDVVKTRRTSSLSNPIGPVQEKKLSVHSLFTSKAPAQVPLGSSPSRPAMSPPQLHQQPIPHIRRQSMGQGGPGFQGQLPVGSPSFTSGPPM
ncbi:hypothetical protein AYX15_05480, partial [Cryptococcus neoformans]